MIVRLTQLDGKLPNLALMRLAAYHRARRDEVHFSRSPYRSLLEPNYDRVYGSAIFDFSLDRVDRLRSEFPEAIIGGTWNVAEPMRIEDYVGPGPEVYDYSIYPKFTGSIGFATRGCRLKCGFCVVPKMEGPPRANSAIYQIWRGDEYPRHLHLLDNDFFGHPTWKQHVADIREGGFRVCFNQGINVRMITDETAAALGSIQICDDGFTVKRLYTAWDNIGDERRFFEGIATLDRHGIRPRNVMAYMLVGYDPRETWERLFYRFNKMVALDIRPYPMVYGDKHRRLPLGGHNRPIEKRTLAEFQRWVIRKAYAAKIPFENYDVNAKGHGTADQMGLEL